jgi:hypothetical protein
MDKNFTAITAGYSGTPLNKKLGIKTGFNIGLINAPGYYFRLFNELPGDLHFNENDAPKDLVHLFTKHEHELVTTLPILKDRIKPNGMIWVSWPKKSSKEETDITEDTIRNFALKI